MRRVYRKRHKTRSVGPIPFRFGSEANISVKIYSLYSETKKPLRVPIKKTQTKTEFEVVKPKLTETQTQEQSSQISTQNPKPKVPPQELFKVYSYGSENFYVSKADELRIVEFEEPAISLLGFKDLSALQSHIHIKQGFFVFPDESTTKGSTTLFNAFLMRCAHRNKIPICRLTLKSSPPRLVALCPQLEDKQSVSFQNEIVFYMKCYF